MIVTAGKGGLYFGLSSNIVLKSTVKTYPHYLCRLLHEMCDNKGFQ